MVSVGRWSDIGGEMVPAVTLFVLVVSSGSISVAELWVVSYLVGVVMVVWRLLLRSRFVKGCSGRSANKFIFKSPWTVMRVFGCVWNRRLGPSVGNKDLVTELQYSRRGFAIATTR